MKRRYRAAGLLLFLGCFCLLCGAYGFLRFSDLGLVPRIERSKVSLDYQGQLLRAFQTSGGVWRFPIGADEVDQTYLALLKAYEDKNFEFHRGVDPFAIGRAVWRNLLGGRRASGGSTLTMQAARLAVTGGGRSYLIKARQILTALAFETRHDKKAILDLYLTLAPFGGNVEGVRAASYAWFGKEPKRLSPSEAALLVALPQSPEARRPDRYPQAARRARDRVIACGYRAGVFSREEAAAARAEPLPTRRIPFPALAPHVSEEFFARHPNEAVFHSTLNLEMQRQLEELARAAAVPIDAKASVAIVVADVVNGQARAIIGGPDLLDMNRAGAMDLTRAPRSPGSVLKPFIYALAFQEGLAHPETLLEDAPSRWGLYAPENFDQSHQGPITARKALQLSLNVPAVELLAALGPQVFLTRLRATGAVIHVPGDAAPGLAIGLGGLGVTLRDAVMLFAGLARGGEILPLSVNADDLKTDPVRMLEPSAAWHVTDILRGAPPPPSSPANQLAFKTGTSYGYRDAWAIGYDRKHVIGVWIGRADNASLPGLIGRLSAAPILFDAFSRIGLDPTPPPRPSSTLVALTQDLPPPLRHIRKDTPKSLSAAAAPPLRIVFPPDGALLDLDESEGRIAIKTSGGAPPFVFLADGRPLSEHEKRRDIFTSVANRGFSRISVIDANGESDSVTVRLH